MSEQNQTLPIDTLETVYDLMATAIDEVDAKKIELFLVKLVLLNAKAIGNAEILREHISIAQKDL
ncbi:MAG: DUF2783 domain-containing protein [Advenella sp.]